MQVVVMTYEGTRHTAGEWDGKVISRMYGRVNGELYPIALMTLPEMADQYVKEMAQLKAVRDQAIAAITQYQQTHHIHTREGVFPNFEKRQLNQGPT